MNVEAFKELRAAVAANPAFDMATHVHECGSAACIIGSAAAILGIVIDDDPLGSYVKMYNWLGVTGEELQWIEMGEWMYMALDDITKEQALAYLDEVIVNGEVMIRVMS